MTRMLPALAAVVAIAWGSMPAAAQVGDDEKKHPPSEVPIDRTPKNVTADVVLKYYTTREFGRPALLKPALERVKGVKSVDLPADSRTATVTFTGLCSQYVSLEAAALNAGFPALVLSHAHVPVTVKPLKGADTKGALAALGQVDGVTEATPGDSMVMLHADLEKLTMENLKAAAAKFNCEIVVNQAYEYVTFKMVEGEATDFAAAAEVVKGVMTARDEGEGIAGLWIHKGHVKVERLQKIEGFKVERQ